MAKKVVLAGACRTAIGKMGGQLSTVKAADLGSIVIKEALKRTGVPADQVDEVLMGCVIQAGQGQNVARQASIGAGLPVEVPAVTIWRLRRSSQVLLISLSQAAWRTCPSLLMQLCRAVMVTE